MSAASGATTGTIPVRLPAEPARTRAGAWTLTAPAVFLLAWGGNHFTPLLHLYETVGGYAPWQANLLLGTYVFGLIPGLLIAAAVSDHLGRKPVAVAGLLASMAGSALLAGGMDVFALLCAGRLLAGLGVGVGMSVGSSWIKELSGAPFEPAAAPTAGARRSALTLTLGFGIGAGVTGAIAQWAPLPGVSPYGLHLILCAAALVLAARAPESLPRERRAAGRWWRDLAVPSAAQRGFLTVIVPAAPWVFGAAGVAYAILPAVVERSLGDYATLYATVLTVATLGVGALAQTTVGWIDRVTRGRSLIVGLVLMVLGIALSAVAARAADPVLAVGCAVVLGFAYGVCVVSGLLIVQEMATPSDLAGITGVYYSLTYVGFLLPTLLAAVTGGAGYATALAIVAACSLACLGIVALGLRAHRRGRG